MKTHALAQRETVGLALVFQAPAACEQRRSGAALLDLHQPFQHVVVHYLTNGCCRRHGRVKAVWLKRNTEYHLGAARFSARRRTQCGQGQDRGKQ